MKEVDRLRPVIFKIALIISLGMVTLLINLSVPNRIFAVHEELVVDDVVMIQRTVQMTPKKVVPPSGPVPSKNKVIVPSDNVSVSADTVVFEPLDTMQFSNVTGQPDSVTGPAIAPTTIIEPPDNDTPIRFPDKNPVFGDCSEMKAADLKACSDQAILSYLQQNIKYPVAARDAGISGTVFVQFVVGKDGSLSDITILTDPGGGCGQEALRVLKTMPQWSPGRQKGRPVPVIFTLPVKFTLL